MAGNRSTDTKSTNTAAAENAGTPTVSRGAALDRRAEAAPLDLSSEAAGVPAQRAAIEQAMAQQNVRLASSPRGAVGPIGRAVLLIALLVVVGLIVVWVALAS